MIRCIGPFFHDVLLSSILRKYGVFNQEWKSCVELINSIGRVEYESCFDLCRDGTVLSTIFYDCLSKKKTPTTVGIQDEELLKDVYKSPIVDIDVDMIQESNSYYYPNGKSMYGENILYDKTIDAHHYEDRGLKHLYEGQHVCKSKDGYCNSCCKSHLSGGNYKKYMFLIENEAMVCSD